MRLSVGMVPYLYILARFAFALECARPCFCYVKNLPLLAFLEEPTLLGAAERKLSSVAFPLMYLELPVGGDFI